MRVIFEMFMNVSENLNAGKCQYFANLLPAGDRQQKADARCEAIRNKQESSL